MAYLLLFSFKFWFNIGEAIWRACVWLHAYTHQIMHWLMPCRMWNSWKSRSSPIVVSEWQLVEAIGRACPHLLRFKLKEVAGVEIPGEIVNEEAEIGISKTMHQLRHLQLIGDWCILHLWFISFSLFFVFACLGSYLFSILLHSIFLSYQ